MNHIQLIQKVIDNFKFKTYLEIGVRKGHCINRLMVDRKTGVDPDPGEHAICQFLMTSDDYFNQRGFNAKFDCIFVDGLHEQQQVMRDIENSLNCLNPGGVIIVDDLCPQTEEEQIFPSPFGYPPLRPWVGDVWKGWVKLRQNHDDLEMFALDYNLETERGIGIIRKSNKPTHKPILTPDFTFSWGDYVENKNYILNIQTIEFFENWLHDNRVR